MQVIDTNLTLAKVVYQVEHSIPDSLMGETSFVLDPDTWENYRAKSADDVWDTTEYMKKKRDTTYKFEYPRDQHIRYRTPGYYFANFAEVVHDTVCDYSKVKGKYIESQYDWKESMSTNYDDEKCAYLLLLWLQGARAELLKPEFKTQYPYWKKFLERTAGSDYLKRMEYKS